MGVIGPDDLESLCARGTNGPEMIFWVDEVSRRLGIEIPRANAAHDRLPCADKQPATLARRFLARMRKHVSGDIRWNLDTHHEQL